MTREIVVNRVYGGFSLSHAAFLRLQELGCKTALDEPDYGEYYSDGSGPRKNMGSGFDMFGDDMRRDDPLLVQVVKEMGEKANGPCANLRVVNVPDDVEWEIAEYDGREWVSEKHRTWS